MSIPLFNGGTKDSLDNFYKFLHVKLKNKQFVEKTEIFYFKDGEVDLEISQKMKINEYVTQIKNKPIKIEIKPAYISNRYFTLMFYILKGSGICFVVILFVFFF